MISLKDKRNKWHLAFVDRTLNYFRLNRDMGLVTFSWDGTRRDTWYLITISWLEASGQRQIRVRGKRNIFPVLIASMVLTHQNTLRASRLA